MTTKQKARKAYDIVEKGWGQGVYVQDKNGDRITLEDAVPGECSFCIMGAGYYVNGGLAETDFIRRFRTLIAGYIQKNHEFIAEHADTAHDIVIRFNDDRRTTKKDVLNLLKYALGEQL